MTLDREDIDYLVSLARGDLAVIERLERARIPVTDRARHAITELLQLRDETDERTD